MDSQLSEPLLSQSHNKLPPAHYLNPFSGEGFYYSSAESSPTAGYNDICSETSASTTVASDIHHENMTSTPDLNYAYSSVNTGIISSASTGATTTSTKNLFTGPTYMHASSMEHSDPPSISTGRMLNPLTEIAENSPSATAHAHSQNDDPYRNISSSTHSSSLAAKTSDATSSSSKPYKRPRRRSDQINRYYSCNYRGCAKSYGTLNHLNAHVVLQKHGFRRQPSEFKDVKKFAKARRREQQMLEIVKEFSKQNNLTFISVNPTSGDENDAGNQVPLFVFTNNSNSISVPIDQIHDVSQLNELRETVNSQHSPQQYHQPQSQQLLQTSPMFNPSVPIASSHFVSPVPNNVHSVNEFDEVNGYHLTH